MESKKDGRFLDDAQSMRAIIEGLPPDVRRDYETYLSRTLESVFPNRYMVVYTLSKGAPVDIELWRFGDITMDRVRGPMAALTLPNGGVQMLSISPTKVGNRDVYLHVPQSFELKWKGKDTPKGIQFAPTYAVLVKTRSREHSQVDGHTYMVTLNKFGERFPGATPRY